MKTITPDDSIFIEYISVKEKKEIIANYIMHDPNDPYLQDEKVRIDKQAQFLTNMVLWHAKGSGQDCTKDTIEEYVLQNIDRLKKMMEVA